NPGGPSIEKPQAASGELRRPIVVKLSSHECSFFPSRHATFGRPNYHSYRTPQLGTRFSVATTLFAMVLTSAMTFNRRCRGQRLVSARCGWLQQHLRHVNHPRTQPFAEALGLGIGAH